MGWHFTREEVVQFTSSHILTAIMQPFPTNDIIARCFIIHFQEREHGYLSHMAGIKIRRCIRLDHTFRVASNIGYLRPDGKWVTLFETIFIVLNEEGVVVAWQFTKSTSLEEVRPLLCKLKERIELPENASLTVYVDNCCQVRKQLQDIFGKDVLVKLDIFHAVQRISRSMSKRHTLFLPCLQDFKMTLRDQVDLGQKRTMHTPNTEAIEQNIEKFMHKWTQAQTNDSNIITPKVVKQLHSLQAHIRHGCLSNIEPSGGTNYNEALHRFINPHFAHTGRIGLPLGYAILTILFYMHNCRKMSKATLLDTVCRKLGLYNTEMPATFGFIPKDCCGHGNDNMSVITADDSSESVIFEENDRSSIPDLHIEHIFKKATLSTEVINNIRRIPGSYGTLSSRMIPFMNSVPSLFFRGTKSYHSHSEEHEHRLSNVLQAWDMCRQNIAGDGNCCFHAVAFSIMANWEALTDRERDALQSHGLLPSMNIETMTTHLRQLTVKEWLGNPSFYQSFLVDSLRVEEEAVRFLMPGYFHGDLADTMVLAIANAIKSTIIVFSSIQCQSVIVVTPRNLETSIPLMLTYTQYGAGHYDAATPRVYSKDPSTPEWSCSCGRDDKSQQEHCNEVMRKYTSIIRCKCLLNTSGCSNTCKCRNCSNPCGKKPLTVTIKPPRKRYCHDWQKYPRENSLDFAKNRMEEINTGPFSTLEYFVLINIVDFVEESELELDTQVILNVYEQVVPISNATINPRNAKDIDTFLKLYKKNLAIFSKLCQNQLKCNLNDIN